MIQPLVSVVCLSYNHEQFVREAIESVLQQTYPRIQLIVVDDASTDNSRSVINDTLKDHPQITRLFLKKNTGNCAAFNTALSLVEGEFVIDFAADDVMFPDKIAAQVNYLTTLDESYGVVFTDAVYCDANGNFLRNHFDHLMKHGLIHEIPAGDVYKDVLEKHFLPSQTLMVRTRVMRELNGYDESLSFEDFDFWVRSSRKYKYGYLPVRSMKIRKVSTQMSAQLYQPGNKQLHSTYIVCRKAFHLNRSKEENLALSHRVRYEIRQSVFTDNREEAKLFYSLLKEMGYVSWKDKLMISLSRIPVKLNSLRKIYLRWRFG